MRKQTFLRIRDDGTDLSILGNKAEEERGSAVVEFVLLAIPLFIPTLILFIALNKTASAQVEQNMIARQLLSAFVTGKDDEQGIARAGLIFAEYTSMDPKRRNLNFRVICQSSPCLKPGSQVEIVVASELRPTGIPDRDRYEVLARARGYVDKWRS